jgi:hypothetical protein
VKSSLNIHLIYGNLKVKTLGAQPLQPNVNLFSFVLPSSGKEVHFKLLTARDEEELTKVLEGKRKTGQIDGAVTARLNQCVVSIARRK